MMTTSDQIQPTAPGEMALRGTSNASAARLALASMSGGAGTEPNPPCGPDARSAPSARRAQRSYLEVAAAPGAVPYARRCTRQTLAAWELGHVAEDAELVVSELMTNAIRATLESSLAAHVVLYLAADPGRLTLLVWDACAEPPVHRPHGDDSAGGRGLEIVQALTSRWGSWVPVRGGKVVWARFDLGRGIIPAEA